MIKRVFVVWLDRLFREHERYMRHFIGWSSLLVGSFVLLVFLTESENSVPPLSLVAMVLSLAAYGATELMPTRLRRVKAGLRLVTISLGLVAILSGMIEILG